MMHTPQTSIDKPRQLLVFDATARRREKMRQKAGTPPDSTSVEAEQLPQEPLQPHDPLEAFLVEFVVRETGMPPENIGWDVDLEEEFGLDSIDKSILLFFEVAIRFGIAVPREVNLDGLRTLRDLSKYLHTAPQGPRSTEPVPDVGQVANLPRERPLDNLPNGLGKMPEAPIAGPTGDSIEAFLINFVVEQTGYPPEIVELDADLEADLGIDSIKKAQLFGELREYFDVRPAANLSLTDFPTLRHVLDFLRATEQLVAIREGRRPVPLPPGEG
jgi:acyl carrier protein